MSEVEQTEDFTQREATIGLTEHATHSEEPNARFFGDKNLSVRFFLHSRQNERKSLEEGRPIFDELEYLEIRIPGDKENIVVRPARNLDKRRFRERYEAFCNGREIATVGTPLEQWPPITRAQCEELKYFGLFTVEQLAEMSDSQSQKFMGISQLKAAAKNYLEESRIGASSGQLQAALEERDNEISTLKAAMEDMAKQMSELKTPAPKRGSKKAADEE